MGAQPSTILRRSAADRYAILIMAGLLAAVFALFVVAGFGVASEMPGAAAFFFIFAAVMAVLTGVVANEATVRWRTRIVVENDKVRLRLPSRRGYVAHSPVEATIRLSSIQAIDTRAEAFRSAGTTVIQRAYALALTDGTRTVLGADRRMVDAYFAQAAALLAERSGATMRDLGTVQGTSGFLMIRGQKVPGWDAASLAPAVAAARQQEEARSWRWLAYVGLALLLVRLLAAFL